jgi:molybdenum cofactor biosynthesis enzyme MoaA
MEKFHCAAIHHNIRFDATADSQVKILPCCMYQTNNHYRDLEAYHASDEIRQLLLAETWPDGCVVCQKQESQGQISWRHHANQALGNIKGTRYELKPSNVCNLKCVMCEPQHSTALAKERHTIGIETVDLSRESNTASQQLEILSSVNDIESISIIGGEFFLTKGNLEIMDFVIEKQVPLRIVTNATVILDSHPDRLKQIQNLELQISIDGYQQGYEIMRYPANWDDFSSNACRLIQELPDAKINFHFVVQALNLQQLVPTLDWCNRQRRSTRVTSLIEPDYLGWQVFSDQERVQAIDLLHEQCEQYQITTTQKQLVKKLCDTIQSVKQDSKSRNQFESTVRKIYEHRWPALRESNSHHMARSHVFYPLN